MAYTIISQNNTTTTLADENGNVITVPARVTLATSTDYTITKVNNNSVDLVDGNGKVIRGVPACVVLAGGGGGNYLPLTGGTLTGDLEMSNSKVQLHNTSYTFSYWLDAYLSGHLRIGKSSSVATGDLFISTGSGGDKSIAFGESGGSVGSADAKLEYIYTQKLSNGSDIAVPTTGGTMAVQVSALPTAASGNVGEIYQYIGATDSTYTNGHFYKCVSDGQDPATYSWSQVSVQPTPSGLPDQTGQSGKFLTTDGTDASWGNALVNNTTQTFSLAVLGGCSSVQSVSLGSSTNTAGNQSVAIGFNALTQSAATRGIAIGRSAVSGAACAIQLGGESGYSTNNDANTFKVGNANGNFELMNANGNLPADRLASTTGLADGNYRLRLVMASGVPTLEWVAE